MSEPDDKNEDNNRKVHTFFRAYDKDTGVFLDSDGHAQSDSGRAELQKLKMNIVNSIKNSYRFSKLKEIVIQEIDVMVIKEEVFKKR